MRKYYDLRIAMHDYIKSLYAEASENGSPDSDSYHNILSNTGI